MTSYLSKDTTIATTHSQLITAALAANIPLKRDIIFEGVTNDDTPTALFIDNIPNNQIVLPNNTVIVGRWMGVGLNTTDGAAVVAGAGTFNAYRNPGGVAAAVSAATGTGFVFTVNPSGNIICTVTGTAGKRIMWRCFVDLHGLSPAAAQLRDGIYTGVNS